MKRTLAFIFSLFVFLTITNQVEANDSIIFMDDFNDGDYQGWSEIRSMQWNNSNLPCFFNGEKAEWKVTNQKIGIEINGPGCVTELLPDNFSLNGVNSFSFEFDMDFPDSTSQDRNYILLMNDLNNSYTIHILGNSINFQTLVNGKNYFLENSWGSFNFEANQTYHFKNEFYKNGQVLIFINDQLVLDVYANLLPTSLAKIGLQASVGNISTSTVYFDNVIVRSLDDQEEDSNLNVPYFSQKDPRWDWEIYDHISQYPWAVNPTMSGYGCATTSMAMILNYHGLTTMPDGTLITPQTLNNWLKTQEDGYIKQGLINWNAVTRLTRQIADSNPGKQKLEYKYSQADSEIVRQEISQQRPVIFRVPGHFVVGHGQSYETFNILDPFWVERTSLNNEFYNNSFESLRLFRPSDTDLSYITIASNLEAHVTLEQENSAPLAIDQFIDGGITDQITGSIQPKFMITQLAKPDEGKYLLTIEGEPGDQYAVEIYAYTQNGSVSPFILEGTLEKPQLKTWLHFSKENGSRIEPIEEMPIEQPLDFDNLLNDIHSLYQSGEVKNRPTHAHFISLLTVGKHAPTHHVKSVLLKNIAKQFEKDKHISQQGKDFFIPRVSLVQKLYQK